MMDDEGGGVATTTIPVVDEHNNNIYITIDEFVKSIENCRNESQAIDGLVSYQRSLLLFVTHQHNSLSNHHQNHLYHNNHHNGHQSIIISDVCVPYQYGLGLLYMHFNAYRWAIQAFRQALWIDPSFERSRDVHIRLGLIFKTFKNYQLSEKHLNIALNDCRPCSLTNAEIKFHLAHLHEIQGDLRGAQTLYEKLLREISNQGQIQGQDSKTARSSSQKIENIIEKRLTREIHRQLGWVNLVFSCDQVQCSQQQRDKERALMHFKLANDCTLTNTERQNLMKNNDDNNNQQTLYLLGRCHASLGQTFDAFKAYKNIVTDTEDYNDIVFKKDDNVANTWCSLGVLYQRGEQINDAMQAYIRCLQLNKNHTQAWMNLGRLYENGQKFSDSIKCYQHALHCVDMDKVRTENLSRQLVAPPLIKIQLKNLPAPHYHKTPESRIRDERAKLKRLENLLQERLSFMSTQIPANDGESFGRTNNGLLSLKDLWNLERNQIQKLKKNASTKLESSNINGNRIVMPNATQQLQNVLLKMQSFNDGPKSLQNLPNGTTTSVAPRLTSNGLDDDVHENISNANGSTNNETSQIKNIIDDNKIGLKKSLSLDTTETTNLNLSINMSAQQVIEICKNLPTAIMNSTDNQQRMQHISRHKKFEINLLNFGEDKDFLRSPYPNFTTSQSNPAMPSTVDPKDRFTPAPPNIFIETKKDALSLKLQDLCHNNPIALVKNFASALKLDLGLFSTKSLVELNGDHLADIVTHLYQANVEENWSDLCNVCPVWSCECHHSQMTLSQYANYQASTFLESLRDEQQEHQNVKSSSNSSASNNCAFARESESDSNCSTSQDTTQAHKEKVKRLKRAESQSEIGIVTKFVKNAFMIDLSDEKKWRPQLQELNKLPSFLRVVAANNMLSHVGHPIAGLNTVRMSMHVPGCRVFARQSHNSFCTIHINVGPGDCEWFAVSKEFTPKLAKMCSHHGIDFNETSPCWWPPKLSELHAQNIPVYRFTQRPGDLVWINAATITWMHVLGWSNTISWSVGPLLAQQYLDAAQYYECNRFEFRRSQVPMVQLTWNLAHHLNLLYDAQLYTCIKRVLMNSLKYLVLVMDFVVNTCKKEIVSLRKSGESLRAHVFTSICTVCECEVFNITFTGQVDKKIHCLECARRIKPNLDNFVIAQEHELSFLMKLYDNFKLGIKPQPPTPSAQANVQTSGTFSTPSTPTAESLSSTFDQQNFSSTVEEKTGINENNNNSTNNDDSKLQLESSFKSSTDVPGATLRSFTAHSYEDKQKSCTNTNSTTPTKLQSITNFSKTNGPPQSNVKTDIVDYLTPNIAVANDNMGATMAETESKVTATAKNIDLKVTSTAESFFGT